MCHMSCATCHVSRVRCSMSLFNHFQTLRAMFTTPYHVSCVPCHMSGVTCYLSLIRCHMSGVTCHNLFPFFLLQSGGVCLCRVCYRWGLPCLVFRLFFIKNALIPKIYLSWLVVVRFWSLEKAN